MAVTVEDATAHIEKYVIDNDDWVSADDNKKTRILNAAERTLNDWADEKLPPLIAQKRGKLVEDIKTEDYTIPNEAIYELSGTLAKVFNDTNKMQQHGIAGFSVTGVGSYTFKQSDTNGSKGQSLDTFITKEALKYVESENGVKLTIRSIKDVII